MIPEIIITSVISIIVLLFRKKKIDIRNINIDIKGYQILIVAAVMEITAEFLYKNFSYSNLLRILSLNWIIYFAIFTVTLLNIKKPYMKLFFMGTILNFIAIASNDFKMPVLVSDILANTEAKKLYLQTGQDLIHSLLTEDTKFKFLCDIITLPPPYPFAKTISIGDILLFFGVFSFWQNETSHH